MKTILVVLICIAPAASLAFGTGVSSFEFNGETLYEAKCNGMARSIKSCLAQASKHCEGLDKHAEILGNDATTAPMPFGGSFIPLAKRSLTFKCVDKNDQKKDEK